MKNLGLILGAVAVVGVGAYFYLNNQNTLPGGDNALIADQQEENGGIMSGSLMELMKLGKNYTCTFEQVDQETGLKMGGTVYVQADNENFRGDFTQETTGGVVESHMLADGEYSYMWSTQMEKGIKTKIEADAEPFDPADYDDAESPAQGGVVDARTEAEFDCKTWLPKPGVFTPPSDVEFVDFAAQVEAMMGGDEASMEEIEAMMEGLGTPPTP